MSLWSWCVGSVWCGTLKASCVHSKRPRVYRHHARKCYHMRAWCPYTRGRFEFTHGGRFEHTHRERGERGERQRDTRTPTHTHTHTNTHANTHTWHTNNTHTTHYAQTHNTEHAKRHRQFCFLKFAHVGLSLDPRGSPQKPLDLTRFQFENRSRTTRSRFLSSFALSPALLRDTAKGISHRVVRFVFRHQNPSITHDLRVRHFPCCSVKEAFDLPQWFHVSR